MFVKLLKCTGGPKLGPAGAGSVLCSSLRSAISYCRSSKLAGGNASNRSSSKTSSEEPDPDEDDERDEKELEPDEEQVASN